MKERIQKQYPYVVVGLVLIGLLILNLFWQDHWLDSDMAAEMMFSKLLSQEGHLFGSTHWYYSSEFRVLYTQLIMVPLFHMTDNWHLIRLITNLVTYLLLLLSYSYLTKPLTLKKQVRVLCSIALLLPFSETEMLHMQIGNTYMPHLILLFFYFGLFLRISGLASVQQTRVTKILSVACFCMIALVFGLSGVRYLLAMQIPLLLTILLWLAGSASFQQVRAGSLRFSQLLREKDLRQIAVAGLGGCMLSVFGFGINKTLIASTCSFADYDAVEFIAVYQGMLAERIQDTIGSLLMLFGYIPEKSVMSLRGIITILSFVILGALFTGLKKAHRTTYPEHRFLILFFDVAFLVNVFVFVFTDSTVVPRYFLTSVCFLVPIMAIYFSEEASVFDRRALAGILCAALLLGSLKCTASMITTDKNASRRAPAAFLTEQGYTFGYATYWNGNILQELTDGAVEVANILDPETMDFFRWSSREAYYEPAYAQGKVFLLLTTAEAAEYADADTLLAGELVYEDPDFVIYSYESQQALLGR